jgi:hypothetical protein
MSIASLTAWRALLPTALQLDLQAFQSIVPAISFIGGLVDVNTVATPSTNETCDNSHAANLLFRPVSPSGKKLKLIHVLNTIDIDTFNVSVVTPTSSCLLLFDRLAQTAGLSGTVTGEQTTNLPGSLPARASDGDGVCAFLRVWTSLGSTGTTFTCRVLGSDNVEYTTPVMEIQSGRVNATVLVPIPLPAGVSGIKEVRGVNLAGTTGTAGNFGVVYLRPIQVVTLPLGPTVFEDFGWSGSGFPDVHDNACVNWAPFIRTANRQLYVNCALRFNWVPD